MKNKKYRLHFKIKDTDLDTGEFVGMASVADVEDLHGDIVEKGAFKRTIDQKNGIFPLLWQHWTSEPIGIVEAKEVEDGLEVKGKLSMGVQKAKEALELVKDKVVRGLSIGFESIKEDVIDGVTHIKEIRLWEVSLVTFPANPLAQVFGAKDYESMNPSMKSTIANLICYCDVMKDDEKSFKEHRSLIEVVVTSINALLESHKALTDPMKDLLAKMRETLADVKSSDKGKDDPEPAEKDKSPRSSEPDLSGPIDALKGLIKTLKTKEK